MNNDEIGKESLSAFIITLRNLIKQGSNFDLIIGAGDSGQAMVWIANEIFETSGKNMPKIIVLPIYRHADDAETIVFDNNYFSEDLKREVDPENVKNILLVDDEVGNGTVVSAIANLIQFASLDSNERGLTVISEDQGYNPPEKIGNVKINFISTKKATEGIYNAISLIVPENLRKEIKSATEGLVEYPNEKLALNALLGLPIKSFNNGNPVFSDEYIGELKNRIPNFEQKQNEFESNLKKVIVEDLRGVGI